WALEAACQPHRDVAPSAPATEPESLGDPGCFPVARGAVVADLSALVREVSLDHAAGPGWTETGRVRVTLPDDEYSLVWFEEQNNGAALVAVRAESPRLRVVGTYAVCWGGLGVSIAMISQARLDDARALLLYRLDARTRGYYADPSDESSR